MPDVEKDMDTTSLITLALARWQALHGDVTPADHLAIVAAAHEVNACSGCDSSADSGVVRGGGDVLSKKVRECCGTTYDCHHRDDCPERGVAARSELPCDLTSDDWCATHSTGAGPTFCAEVTC